MFELLFTRALIFSEQEAIPIRSESRIRDFIIYFK